VIAVRVLAEKGIPLPPKAIRKMARSRVRAVLLALGKRGVCRVVGIGEDRKRELCQEAMTRATTLTANAATASTTPATVPQTRINLRRSSVLTSE